MGPSWTGVRTLRGEGDICAEVRAGAWVSWGNSGIVGPEMGVRVLTSEAMDSASWETLGLFLGDGELWGAHL